MRASWQHYGTYDESAHPDLWDGVVGYWAPCLGPTGTRLFDVSRYNNWGTLTNMDAATDWVINGGQYALDLDGTNDNIVTGAARPYSPGTEYAVGAWVYNRSLPSSGGFASLLCSYDVVSSNIFGIDFRLRNDAGTQRLGFIMADGTASGGGADVAYTLATNTWVHLIASRQGGTLTVYANGVSVFTVSGSKGIVGSATKALTIGGFGFYTPTSSDLGRNVNGLMDDVVLWQRGLDAASIRTLYNLGRGGMLERRRRRRVAVEQGAAFKAYWARRQNQIIGGGV
jgi:hypothetical protein